MIPLGAVAKDTITGFEGVVTGRTEWLNGCVRLYLQPQELHEGQPSKERTFDEPQVVRVQSHYVPDAADTELEGWTSGGTPTGGPRKGPGRRSDPVR